MLKYFLIIGVLVISFNIVSKHVYSSAELNMPKEGVYVLELFTSQSCSSCPAADAFLEELDKQENIIALSCNVTYWNHLHWEDTLSKEFCTDKQRDYSYAQNRSGRIFTPELMINGEKSLVGSARGKIISYLSEKAKPAIKLNLRHQGDHITVGAIDNDTLSSKNTVTLIAYGSKHEQFVPSGENRGRVIHYSNPVLSMSKIAQNWNWKTPITSSISSDMPPTGYVVLISDKMKGGKIIAAGKIEM